MEIEPLAEPDSSIPLSCGEAWILFYGLEGSYGNYTIRDMQQAFNTGWDAAATALRQAKGGADG